MDKKKFKCYACDWEMTNNGTEKRKNHDIRVQRCTCRNRKCGINNVFVVIESKNQSLIGKYFFPKIKGRVFTIEEASSKYVIKNKSYNSMTAEFIVETTDDKKQTKALDLLMNYSGIPEENRMLKKVINRKKAVQAALERNLRKVEKLQKILEEIEDELREFIPWRETLRTREDIIEYIESGGMDYGGQNLK